MSVSTGRPSVSVPVLSQATTLIAPARSRVSASRTRMPARAAAPVPTMIAVGVASPSAHGHAITSTAIAWSDAAVADSPASQPTPRVSRAAPSTTGTNTALTRSTSFWIGALLAWAPSTSRTIRASVVSSPTAPTMTATAPSTFSVPSLTGSPGPFATGRGSPVSMDSSKLAVPSRTCPSAGTRSPGLTSTTSPGRSSATGSVTSTPARRARAVSGRSATSARIAAAVWPVARASSHLPTNTNVITSADDSKYSAGGCPCPCDGRSSVARLSPQAAVVPRITSRSIVADPPRAAFQAAR